MIDLAKSNAASQMKDQIHLIEQNMPK